MSWEADYFGNENFIFSTEGKENYKEEINDGKFYFINSNEEFYEILNTLNLKEKLSKVNAFAKVDLYSAFENLLKAKM